MDRAPTSLESLRVANRLRVMAVLQRRGHASRADIVRATGLSRTTVSSLVAELLEQGVVVERPDLDRPAAAPERGRPGTLLTLDPSSGAFIGLDFGHELVRVALVDRSGALLADTQEAVDVDHDPGAALELASAGGESLLAQTGLSEDRLLGVGVAVSAPLRSGGTVAFASRSIFADWAAIDPLKLLAERFRCPVHIGNDANLGALAECTFGAGRGIANLLYVMLSAGVGLGLWLHGSLYTGDTGTAGELGHVVVDPGGQVCRCGNRGCLETVAGIGALTEALRYVRGRDLSQSDLLALAASGDPGTVRLLSDAGMAVGRALAGLCSVLDPALVIVGGELAGTGQALLDAIAATIDREASPAAGHSYPVLPGTLGTRAEALGAAALAMDRESRLMTREDLQ